MSNKIDYQQLLEQILSVCKELGYAPELAHIKDYNIGAEQSTIKRYFKTQTEFKSYYNFCRENGYKFKNDIEINNKYYSSNELNIEQIVFLIKEYYNKNNNKYPVQTDFSVSNNLPPLGTLKKFLKKNNLTITEIFEMAGNTENINPNHYPYDYWLEKFKEECSKIGYAIKYRDFNKHGLPDARWFITHCPNKDVQNYNDFILWVGIYSHYNIPKDKCIEYIYKKQEELNRPLKYNDFRNNKINEVCLNQILNHWGTFNNMKKELGLEIIQEDMVGKQKSKEEMINDLQEFINELGRLPLEREIDNNKNILNASTYNNKIGSINDIYISLGYKPNKKSISLGLSNDEIKNIYKDFIEKMEFTPTFDMCKKIYKLPAPITVCRRFNCTWNEFMIDLGYEPNEQKNIQNFCYTKDGSLCLSVAECSIHNFLLDKNIDKLEKEILYRDLIDDEGLQNKIGFKRCDWIFKYNNKLYIVEYFGMMGIESYNKTHDLKLEVIKEANLQDNFIAIYPNQLHKLDEIFEFIPNKESVKVS